MGIGQTGPKNELTPILPKRSAAGNKEVQKTSSFYVGGPLNSDLEPLDVDRTELRAVNLDRQFVELRGQGERRLVIRVVHAGEPACQKSFVGGEFFS